MYPFTQVQNEEAAPLLYNPITNITKKNPRRVKCQEVDGIMHNIRKKFCASGLRPYDVFLVHFRQPLGQILLNRGELFTTGQVIKFVWIFVMVVEFL